MKGYFIDISCFGYKKQELTLFAICALSGGGIGSLTPSEYSKLSSFKWAGNIRKDGSEFMGVGGQNENPTPKQEACLISFDDLMDKYGFNYVEDGDFGFKHKSVLKVKKKIERLDQMVESLNNNSTTVSELKSEIESLHGQLRSKSEEIGKLNVKLHETEKELSKSRISGAIIFACLVVVAISNLFFGG